MDAMMSSWPHEARWREFAATEPDDGPDDARRGTQGAPPMGRAGVADRPEELVVEAWHRHHHELTAYLVHASRDPDAAEDFVQEAYLRLLGEVRAGRAPTNVRAWLYRVAGNLVIDRGRRQASARRCLDRVSATTNRVTATDQPTVAVLEREAARERLCALAGLNPRARRVLLLTAEGLGGREVAQAIGCSHVAARTLLHRARVQARACLSA